jgi:hypothetical protein
MERADRGQDLTDDDVLSLWVGRVARTHALLEYDVDNVHRFLARRVDHLPATKSVTGFDQLVRECRKLLQQSGAGREIETSGDTALLAAAEATHFRNRVVHDMWLSDPVRSDWEPPRWNTFRRLNDLQESYNTATSQDLTTVVDTHARLTRTRVRVSGLFMALHATWPVSRDPVRTALGEDGLARYIALMTDHFVLHANGDFDIT